MVPKYEMVPKRKRAGTEIREEKKRLNAYFLPVVANKRGLMALRLPCYGCCAVWC